MCLAVFVSMCVPLASVECAHMCMGVRGCGIGISIKHKHNISNHLAFGLLWAEACMCHGVRVRSRMHGIVMLYGTRLYACI